MPSVTRHRRIQMIVALAVIIGVVIGWLIAGLVFEGRYCGDDSGRFHFNWLTFECTYSGLR